jgi:hypothetical protein
MDFSNKKYSVKQVRKVKCFRCGKSPCYSQIKVNMISDFYLPICDKCDYEARKFILFFLNVNDMDKILSCFEEKIDMNKWNQMKVAELGKILNDFVAANKNEPDVMRDLFTKLENTIDQINHLV